MAFKQLTVVIDPVKLVADHLISAAEVRLGNIS